MNWTYSRATVQMLTITKYYNHSIIILNTTDVTRASCVDLLGINDIYLLYVQREHIFCQRHNFLRISLAPAYTAIHAYTCI